MKSFSNKSVRLVLILAILMAVFIPAMVNANDVGRIGTSKVGEIVVAYTAGNSQVYVNKITKSDGTVVRYVYSKNYIVTPESILKLKSILEDEYSSLIPDNYSGAYKVDYSGDYSGDYFVGIKVCSDSSLVDSMDENWTSSEWVGRNVVATRTVKNVTNESGDGINQTVISDSQSLTVLFDEIKDSAEAANRAVWEEIERIKKAAWDSGEAAKKEEDPSYIPQEYVYSEYAPLDFGTITETDIKGVKTLANNQVGISAGIVFNTSYSLVQGKLIKTTDITRIDQVANIFTAHTIIDDSESTIEKINVKLEIPKAKTEVTFSGETEIDYKYTQNPRPKVTLSKNANYKLGEYDGNYEETPVDATFWYVDSGATELFSGEMIAGKTYYADLWFEPNDGYVISENVKIMVNSKQYNATTDGTIAYHVIVPVTIKSSSSSSGGGGGSTTSNYKITTKIENGTITPANTSVKKDADQEFTFKANDGYEITDVLVDGKSIGVVDSYKLEKVTAKHTIEVKTQKISALSNVDDWAKDEMAKAEDKGLIPETFKNKDASKEVSRTDFSAVAVKLYEALTGKEAEIPANNPFTDTNDDYVLKAYALGITKGVSESSFGNGTITREQMSTMIDRALNKAGIDTTIDLEKVEKFADDKEIHDWARPSVYSMSEKGIVKGVGDNKFNPLGVAKLEEALAISVRCVEEFTK